MIPKSAFLEFFPGPTLNLPDYYTSQWENSPFTRPLQYFMPSVIGTVVCHAAKIAHLVYIDRKKENAISIPA